MIFTKKCAIAKGTFYRFFKSKEDFIYELMIYERDKEKQALLDALDSEGHLSQSAFKNYVKDMFHNSVNVFSYMTQEENHFITSVVAGRISLEC